MKDTRPSYDPHCYLCPGNERAGGHKNENYTSTYSFTNDFAALLPDQGNTKEENGLLISQVEEGICKVVCFSPDHSLTMAQMKIDALLDVIDLWEAQFKELGAHEFINNVQIFENKGQIMGCSNPHPHGQIWAQRSIPNEIQKKTISQMKYFETNKKSLLGFYLEQEQEAEKRIVFQNQHFVCLVPFWAVWPYETMLIPKRHFASIAEMTQDEKRDFAEALSLITIKYDNLFQTSFPYSAGMQQRPTNGGKHEGWHFHYSFYPPLLRSAKVKKFMVGYEMFANPQRDITAEQAAQTLKELSETHYLEND